MNFHQLSCSTKEIVACTAIPKYLYGRDKLSSDNFSKDYISCNFVEMKDLNLFIHSVIESI